MSLTRTLLLAATTALCFSAAAAHASGFQLKEQSSSMQGHSFAGASAKADDLSTLFFNPAGMTRLPQGQHAGAQVSYTLPSAKFETTAVVPGLGGNPTIADGDGGDAGVGAFVPAFYGAASLNDRWYAGLAVNTPFGLTTKYENGWVGRYYALESSLITINMAPTVAYKLSDTLSFGANVQAQYIEAKLTSAVNFGIGDGRNKLVGNDIGFGYALGLIWQPQDDTRLGLNYRSRIQHEVEGDIRVTNPAGATVLGIGATADVTTPDILSLGIAHELNDRWTILGEAAWTNWSLFDRLVVVDDGGVVRQNVNQDWHDTMFFSAGAEYKYTQALTLRGGVAYDQGAVDTETRTFRIPESDRMWASVGGSYALNPATSFDLGYSYLHARKSRVTEDDIPANGSVSGTFDANVNILTAGVSVKF